MVTKSKSISPSLFMAWFWSLLLVPISLLLFGMIMKVTGSNIAFILIPLAAIGSLVFTNVYIQKLPTEYKYLPGLIGSGLLYFVNPTISIIYLSITLLFGLFDSFYRKEFTLFESETFSVGIVSLVFLAVGAYVFMGSGIKLADITQLLTYEMSQVYNNEVFKGLVMPKASEINLLVLQAPSVFMVILSMILFVGVIYEKKFLTICGLGASIRQRLSHFKVPEFMVWAFILSMAGFFIDHGNIMVKLICGNILNICVVSYFFQGFAILFNFFEVFKVSRFTKLIMIFCLVFQIPPVTSVIGLLDYWFNFRGRFLKKATQVKERSGL